MLLVVAQLPKGMIVMIGEKPFLPPSNQLFSLSILLRKLDHPVVAH